MYTPPMDATCPNPRPRIPSRDLAYCAAPLFDDDAMMSAFTLSTTTQVRATANVRYVYLCLHISRRENRAERESRDAARRRHQ